MSGGVCDGCGHVISQCQCGTMSKDGYKVQINFTKLFCDWWRKAKEDHERRITVQSGK
jgi:hypothetical protein